MSRSRLCCPDCGKVLATRRQGAIRPETNVLIEGSVVILLCICGGRRVVTDVVPYLLPIR